jgi:hypothetical protein
MSIGPRFAERRKYPRHKLASRAYVVNVCRPGLVTDISQDGLSWHYIDRKCWPAESPTLDLVVDDLEFCLERIPYQVVSDCEVEHDSFDPALKVRRRSVKFGKLTDQQCAGLEEMVFHCDFGWSAALIQLHAAS